MCAKPVVRGERTSKLSNACAAVHVIATKLIRSSGVVSRHQPRLAGRTRKLSAG